MSNPFTPVAILRLKKTHEYRIKKYDLGPEGFAFDVYQGDELDPIIRDLKTFEECVTAIETHENTKAPTEIIGVTEPIDLMKSMEAPWLKEDPSLPKKTKGRHK